MSRHRIDGRGAAHAIKVDSFPTDRWMHGRVTGHPLADRVQTRVSASIWRGRGTAITGKDLALQPSVSIFTDIATQHDAYVAIHPRPPQGTIIEIAAA